MNSSEGHREEQEKQSQASQVKTSSLNLGGGVGLMMFTM